MNSAVDTWWDASKGRSDQDMEDGHQVYWERVIEELEGRYFQGKSIIDIGCNQGGFLRKLCQSFEIQEGFGVDLTRKSVDVANQRKGNLPLSYRAITNLELEVDLKQRFDCGISTSVVYLVQDLSHFARQASHCLKSGGVFFVDFADYDYLNSAAMKRLRDEISNGATIPLQNHNLDSISQAFADQGFSIAIKRFAPRNFIPLTVPDRWYGSVAERLEFEYSRTYLFKMTKN